MATKYNIKRLMAREIEVCRGVGLTERYALSIATVYLSDNGIVEGVQVTPYTQEKEGVIYSDHALTITIGQKCPRV